MNKTLLLCGVFALCLWSSGCQSAAATDRSETRGDQPVVQPTATKPANVGNKTAGKVGKLTAAAQTVNFKGASFKYNPQIFDAVETEDVVDETPLESAEDMPGGEFPKHTAFRLKYKQGEATLRILPIADYRRMYAVSKDAVKSFDEKVKNLRQSLVDEKFRADGEIPFVPFYEARQTATAKVKHFSFQNGKGIFFLTYYGGQDFASIVNNEGLTYVYQGISADGKKYVWAEFPTSAPFLPNDSQADEFEGYKLPQSYDDFNEKAHDAYVAKIAERLETLPPDKFEPSLKHFEEIISSLKF